MNPGKVKYKINWSVVIELLLRIVAWIALLMLVRFAWVGAECTLDGVGQLGKVDQIVCVVITFNISRWIGRIEEKIRKGGNADDHRKVTQSSGSN